MGDATAFTVPGVHVLGVSGAGAYAVQMTAQGASSSFQTSSPVSLQQLLEVVVEFDRYGGASPGLVAWELCVEEQLVAAAWQRATRDGFDRPRRSRSRGTVVAAQSCGLGGRNERHSR